MVALVTLEQAKAHLQMDHDLDDTTIQLMLEAASEAVINHLKSGADVFLDSSGEVLQTTDSPPEPDVPKVVQQATLLLLGDFYKNREPAADDPVPAQFGFGFLPRAVTALLYSLRDPALR